MIDPARQLWEEMLMLQYADCANRQNKLGAAWVTAIEEGGR